MTTFPLTVTLGVPLEELAAMNLPYFAVELELAISSPPRITVELLELLRV